MIFPNVSLTAWLKKYPDLVDLCDYDEFNTCADCETPFEYTIPYISKDFAGLASEPCKGCGNPEPGRAFIPISKEYKEKTKFIIDSLL